MAERKGMSKVIGIIGTRRRDTANDFHLVENAFIKVYERGDSICSGLCPKGGDRFAVMFAKRCGCKTIWHPAQWNKHGKAAGFIRNGLIARDSDVLIACVAEDRKGGTEDTIKKFLKLGKTNLILV